MLNETDNFFELFRVDLDLLLFGKKSCPNTSVETARKE